MHLCTICGPMADMRETTKATEARAILTEELRSVCIQLEETRWAPRRAALKAERDRIKRELVSLFRVQ